MTQPLTGWIGHDDPFAFTPDYQPAAGIGRFQCGTPPILSLVALECGVETLLATEPFGGMAAVRAKSLELTSQFIELVDALLDEAERVLLGVDREAARIAELVGVGAQHAGAGRVEGHHPHGAGAVADERLDALAHLLRGLVGERDREDLAGTRPLRVHQVGDPVGQHARLARAGAGQDERVLARQRHGRLLFGIEIAQERRRGRDFWEHTAL